MISPVWRRSILLLILSVGASIYICLLRVATEGGVPYLGFIFWHSLGGAILMLLILAVRRTRVPMGRAHLRFYAASAFFGLAIPYLAMTFASPNIPVGVLSMTITIEPALTYLLALVLLLERYRSLRFVGLLIGIAGLLLILLPEASLPSREMVPWVLVGLAMPASWAVWSNWMAYDRPPEVDSAVTTFGLLAFGAGMLLPAVVAMDELWWFDAERVHLSWLIPVFAVLNVWVLASQFRVHPGCWARVLLGLAPRLHATDHGRRDDIVRRAVQHVDLGRAGSAVRQPLSR